MSATEISEQDHGLLAAIENLKSEGVKSKYKITFYAGKAGSFVEEFMGIDAVEAGEIAIQSVLCRYGSVPYIHSIEYVETAVRQIPDKSGG